ncbi:guanine nucleotide-binding protein-like 3 [Oxyura jamaicensis]|uniref:guanine nucleotide-binding protein-like 3 n=1 Tax=Oxyura jamaicensis TaxID=8884 RepID=UPI0015A6DD69|nr:guanine nucleotide-binding protein-like 3 [Oxyura jamaicensis]
MKRPRLRKASKRLSCHKRYKIQKKIREHHRKVRKEAKKRGRKKPKKDPGVPSAAPFKEALLREAEQRKQRLEELKQKQKLDRQKEHEKKRKLDAKKNAAKIQEQTEGTEPSSNSEANTKKGPHKKPKKSFHSELEKVIEASDVVLEVLDARDPMGCRCPQLEQAITCSGGEKKLLLVLNKIDLVPKENLEKWLNCLKKEFPTVAFKSATLMRDRTMQEHFSRKRARVDLSRNTECFGSECLLKLLQEHCKTQNKAIQVGLVGFPNVGKSSIINSLKKDRVCNVGPARGLTKYMQVVRIDKQMRVLDSPSIVADPANSTLTLALRSIIDAGESGSIDVIEAMDTVLNHCSKQQVMMFYSIPDFRNTEEFLTLLAQKRGMLKKGGVPDIENIAKLLLCDWTGGKISYHSQPPGSQMLPPYLAEDKIAEMQKGFNLKKLEEENNATIQALKYPSPSSSIVFQSAGMTNGKIKENKVIREASQWESLETSKEEGDFMETDDQDSMEEEEEEKDVKEESKIRMTRKAKLGKQQTRHATSENKLAESGSDSSLSFSLDKTADEDDAYDFNTDYV